MPGVFADYNFDDWNMKLTEGGFKKKKTPTAATSFTRSCFGLKNKKLKEDGAEIKGKKSVYNLSPLSHPFGHIQTVALDSIQMISPCESNPLKIRG